jgi:ubiquinone/menaquinone biosynthesis C-methylase UbiE
MKQNNASVTDTIRRRYNRMAYLFWWMDRIGPATKPDPWRSRLMAAVRGPRALEVGVGTGKNLPYYPKDVSMSAIDFSPNMLSKARVAAQRLNISVDFQEMDIQHLDFPNNFFDTVFATFVFCSVPDPILGLRELRRVCKPRGRLLLLEHMRPRNFAAGLLFDALNPVTVRISGANINRLTNENILNAGWRIEQEEHLLLDVVRLFQAVPRV